MMNSISFKILLMLLLWNVQLLKSQNLIATYTESRKLEGHIPDDPDPQVKELLKNAGTQNKELILTSGTSIYHEKKAEMEDGPDHMVMIRIGDDDRGSVYKNLIQKQLIKQYEFFGRLFLIRETLNPISWKLENDQKKIGTYNCKKATAIIDTMNITAWYCPDISVNDGPDIFWGLPGLILEINIDNGKKIILVNTIKITNEPLTVEIPDKGKEVSAQEFKILKKEKLDELKKNHVPGTPQRVEIRIEN